LSQQFSWQLFRAESKHSARCPRGMRRRGEQKDVVSDSAESICE
jgi:hypothetical protein